MNTIGVRLINTFYPLMQKSKKEILKIKTNHLKFWLQLKPQINKIHIFRE